MVLAERELTGQAEAEFEPATILLCAWRDLKADTAECLLAMRDLGWGYVIKRGDALITRSRAVIVSNWYQHTDEDVFLMIDDDVVFAREHCESIIRLAREKRSIVCGAYPVKDGTHLACRRLPSQDILFGKDAPCVEIQYPATGFMAVHRDVIDALVQARGEDGEPLYPFCDQGGNFYPFFDTLVVKHGSGKYEDLSEDYAFGERARRLGFTVWLDGSVVLYHMGTYPYTIENMKNTLNLCGDCAQSLDKDGRGHRLDCPTQMAEVVLKTSRGFEMAFDAKDGVITEAVRATGQWEETVAEAIEANVRPGDRFLDLGAHVGYFSLLAASLGAEVTAIEANPHYAHMLYENLSRNHLAADICGFAVGGREAEAFLQVDERFFAHPSAAHVNDVSGMAVQVRRLAQLLGQERLDVIKADIEGLEYAVFADSPEIVQAARCVIFEVGPRMCERYGVTPPQVVGLLRGYGFAVTHTNGAELTDDWLLKMRIDQYANLIARKVEAS